MKKDEADLIPPISIKIMHVSEKVEIKKQYCTVVQLKDIEEAERLALHWNGYQFQKNSGVQLKATVHPFSYRKRPVTKQSRHTLFKNVYNPNLDDSLKAAQPLEHTMNELLKMQPKKEDAQVAVDSSKDVKNRKDSKVELKKTFEDLKSLEPE